jgi:hypothetical protein
VVFVALLGALLAFNLARYRDSLLDDAFISLRYAANLVAGNGLVFNPGERVEGYTNFAWVMLGAGALASGVDPVLVLKTCSLLAAALLLLAMHRLHRLNRGRAAPEQHGAIHPLLWLLPLPAFAYWATTTMETMLFASLSLWALTLALEEAEGRRGRLSIVLFVCLALTRPDGVIFFVAATVAVATASCWRHRSWRPLLRHLGNAGLFGCLFAPYFLWRLHYYGRPLPNTFYAKVTGGPEQVAAGLTCLADWARAHPLFAVTAIAPITLLWPRLRRNLSAPHVALALWMTALGVLAYVVGVGGDFMPFYRFFLPLLPLCAVLLASCLDSLHGAGFIDPRSRPARIALAWLVAAHVGCAMLTEQPMRAFVAHRTTVVGEHVGSFLAGLLDDDDLVAVNTAGSLPYWSRLPTLDMLGLTDPAIAAHDTYVISPTWAGHRRGWGDEVLKRRPQVVLWYNSSGAARPHYLGDHQLADNPYFRFFYQLKRSRLEGSTGGGACFLGLPFGTTESGRLVIPDLGLQGETRSWPVPHTVLRSAPITVIYFERRRDLNQLWPAAETSDGDIDAFLAAVVAQWRREAAEGGFDPLARQQVHTLCDRALAAIKRGDRRAAKQLLSQAAGLNQAARSPRVYRYVANLGVLEGELFLALQAQVEALRLDPTDELGRSNLRHLLTVPLRTFSETHSTRPAPQ